ncbi:TetR/AcrR family transcriptional regulator [Mycolicibacterium diernhoferi]|uniref:TetR family transcriptional regulator n=1 Tax=Mycolicibacterium diernhoferi TaxID=1801 RepID=A0A1Q4H4S4_9MYCO|nr:TetR/AcrR family transcriptional regulator [Mycolicibacterium diernhoferi]OJZ62020.1 TetR family transcriptional regulator [Mycolicibacterium diernhoferi]OPE55159.1 TetR family transcriptional regulator [Mycolicibacterium diernhoferi]PEG51644.1 TetR/AcrR family transcriptional regulator [Mycolicibacterium diernhoferi]QYL24121.1 TetR/AcrR family transcriptional regulator [Mycolicibacterium diernhoferi]
MGEPRRRLSPGDRRSELLILGAEVFGQRPYDEVRIDEIAERAGVSRALMYHYFPDKRAFFAAVVRAEGERLFEATNAPLDPDHTLFGQVREGVLAYLRYDEQHPHGAWAAYMGIGRADPVLRGLDDEDGQANDKQADRIIGHVWAVAGAPLDEITARNLRAVVYGWLAFTFELCRQRVLDPTMDAGFVADTCAHNLLDALGRVPDIPAKLVAAVAPERR